MASALDPPSTATMAPLVSPSSKLWRTVSIFLPAPLREASKEGLLRTLAYVALSVTVLPLLIAFLAAFWLTMISDHVGLDFVQSVRRSYIRAIQQGFSTGDLRKVDYIQPIALHMQPNAPPANFSIYLEPRQHAQVTLTTVMNNPPETDTCRFQDPGSATRLVAVRLNEVTVIECPRTANGTCTQELDRAWWNGHSGLLSADPPMSQLTIVRTDQAATGCFELEVEGRMMVYKDVYP
jgi:hypothetical protein